MVQKIQICPTADDVSKQIVYQIIKKVDTVELVLPIGFLASKSPRLTVLATDKTFS